MALSSTESTKNDINSGRSLPDLLDVKYTVLLCEDPSKLQVFLDRLNDSAGMLEMSYEPSSCKIPLEDWIGSKPNSFP